MKIKHLLTKTLLVAAGLLVGQSVWADEINLTPSETTEVRANGDTSKGQEANTNGDNNYYNAEATSWLCTQANISNGQLNNQNIGYGGSYAVITKFDGSTKLAGMNITKATLKFKSVCTVSGKNSNVKVASIGTDWAASTVTWNNLNKAATQISAGNGQNVGTSEKTLSEDVTDLLKNDDDKIVAFAIYTYTAREQKISDIVLEVEAIDAASSADVTLKYVDGNGTELKSATVVGTSGSALTLTDEQKANFFKDDQKYIYVSDNSAEIIVASDGSSVITLTYREAETWTYTLNAVDGESKQLQVLSSKTGPEGEKINVGYAAYINVDGSLWGTGKDYSNDKKGFQTSVTLSENNIVKNLTYSDKGVSNVVYLSEGENIPGMQVCNTSNATIRSSNAAAAFAPNDVIFTTLPAGVYKLHVICYDAQKNANSDWTFKAGEATLASIHCGTINYYEAPAVEFTLSGESDITIAKGGANNIGIDLIYIEKTDDAPTSIPATISTTGSSFASTAIIDCSKLPDGVTAYKVSAVADSKATLTEVTEAVAPGTGLILIAGTAGSYDLPVAATGNDISATNKLVGVTVAKTVAADEAYGLKDGKFNKLSAGTIPANKAYLPATAVSAPELTIVFGGEATGIADVRSKKADVRGEIYNLNGQRVAQPAKGLYIVNGRKAIIK
jgi:hypothetical protein